MGSFFFFATLTRTFMKREVINMRKYSYEEVKQAYVGIIEVGKMSSLFGNMTAQMQHTKNLEQLDGAAKDLYIKLMTDKSINYQA